MANGKSKKVEKKPASKKKTVRKKVAEESTKAVVPRSSSKSIVPSDVQLDINPQALIQSALTKEVDVAVIEKLLDMRDRLRQEKAKEAFLQAMSYFQANCPIITKTKAVMNKDNRTERYRYAPLDIIVKKVQPLLAKTDLSYEIDTVINDNTLKAVCVISHIMGHSKTSTFEVPIGTEQYMSDPQKFGARSTFAKRYAFCNGFGILTGDEDTDDGGYNPEPEAEPIDIEKIKKEASNLIETSQTLDQLNKRGSQLMELTKKLPDEIVKTLGSDYKRRQGELMEIEKNRGKK